MYPELSVCAFKSQSLSTILKPTMLACSRVHCWRGGSSEAMLSSGLRGRPPSAGRISRRPALAAPDEDYQISLTDWQAGSNPSLASCPHATASGTRQSTRPTTAQRGWSRRERTEASGPVGARSFGKRLHLKCDSVLDTRSTGIPRSFSKRQ